MSKSANGIKYVFAVILLVLAMLLAYETWGIVKTIFSPDPPMTVLGNLAMYQWTAIGAVVFLVLKRFWLTKNLQWFEVFTHELTHTVVSLLTFRKMSNFQAGEKSGAVYTSGGSLSGILVSLAPYCLPIYSYFLLMLRPIIANEGLWIYDILLGITLAFHASCFASDTRNYQTDINQFPYVFSYSYIAAALLFNLNAILVSFWTSKNIFTAWWYCLKEVVPV